MKIRQILKLFKDDFDNFIDYYGDNESDDDCFYVLNCEYGEYYKVDISNSYWYFEDDGTVVFRINDMS